MTDQPSAPTSAGPVAGHGAFVSDEEVHRLVEMSGKSAGEPNNIQDILDGAMMALAAGFRHIWWYGWMTARGCAV